MYEPRPNPADLRRKKLVQKLMGQQGGGRTPMPAAAEGLSFHGAGRFAGAPRAAQTHASSIAQSILDRLGGGMHDGLEGEFSHGPGMAIGRPPIDRIPGVGPPPPVSPPIPAVQPPGVNPLPPTGPITPAPGSSGPVTNAGDPSAKQPAVGGALVDRTNLGPAPDPGTKQPAVGGGIVDRTGFIPLGSGLYYDPATDTVIGHSSAGAGGSASRL